MSAFSALKVGDTFELEDNDGIIKYIKVQELSLCKGEMLVNVVCIDPHRDEIGQFAYISENKNCNHINWS